VNGALGQLLLLISGSLLIPDLALLLGFALFCVANLGGLLAEALARTRHRPDFAQFVRATRRRGPGPIDPAAVPARFGLPRLAFAEIDASRHAPGKLLDDLQLQADRALGRLHLGIRLGPMLGLAGTLIPLGPSLQALASGDTKKLADGLIIAFATPVVGMLIGGLCFFMHSLRRRWYTQDLNDIEFLLSRVPPPAPGFQEDQPCASYATSAAAKTTRSTGSPTSSTWA
jgi:biopolymer transport protein ExbB/TolQ